MDRPRLTHKARRYVGYVSRLGTTQLHLRNPYVIAFWSAAFPGMGHLLLSKYLRGFLLFGWEVIVNRLAHINLAILYSFTGQFNLAREVLDIRWVMLYIPTYIFAIWDSYRTTVDINGYYKLALIEGARINTFNIGTIEFNYLDKRKPWVSFVWSLLMPGAGQVYIHRIVTAFFVLTWWIVIVYNSKLLPAIHYSLLGDFKTATSWINQQWFLNIPSVYFFAAYDCYTNTVENNKLFEWELSKFLQKKYQSSLFPMPDTVTGDGTDDMYIVATFEHSKYLELALAETELLGIDKHKILAIPTDKRNEARRIFDSIHYSDGQSLFDVPMILATFIGLFASIYGFIFPWGPVIWGLIGMTSGFGLGLAIKLVMVKGKKNQPAKRDSSEVIVMINCQKEQADVIKKTLWGHYALTVTSLDLNTEIG